MEFKKGDRVYHTKRGFYATVANLEITPLITWVVLGNGDYYPAATRYLELADYCEVLT